jgi:hypothetical protein
MKLKELPRNVLAASLTSFLMDISSEMVLNLVPLFLANVLGAGGTVIGAVEGVAESVASLLRVVSGYISDRLRRRKWLAVLGYGISALSKPFFYFAGSWWHVALARWADRVGKGIRTAPRDALVADSIDANNRGLAFGFHRAADTAGAFLGILGALLAVAFTQGGAASLAAGTFRLIVLVSVVPAVLAVLSLSVLAREPRALARTDRLPIRFSGLGRPFLLFLLLVGMFELGNSADAFLVLRAQTLGASVLEILGMLAVFNSFIRRFPLRPALFPTESREKSSSLAAGFFTGSCTLGSVLPARVGRCGPFMRRMGFTTVWRMGPRGPLWPISFRQSSAAPLTALTLPWWGLWPSPLL